MKKRLVMGTLTAALIAGSVPYEIHAQQEVMIQSEEGGPEEPSEPEQPEPAPSEEPQPTMEPLLHLYTGFSQDLRTKT